MGLDDEGVLLLLLAVHQATGPQLALAGRPVQHHRLERSLEPVDVERTDFPWRRGREEEKREGLVSVTHGEIKVKHCHILPFLDCFGMSEGR